MKKSFSSRLTELRGSASKLDFCRKTGISYTTYGRYESGERYPDWESILKICTTCNVSADWVLGLSDIRETNRAPPPMPARGLAAADPSGPDYLSAPAACPACAAKQAQIDKLVDTLHNLSVGRSTPARNSVSAPGKY